MLRYCKLILKACTKISKGVLLGLRQFLVAESSLEKMKNGFYFILKAFFVREIFEFLSWLSGHLGKWLNEKAKTGKQIINIHIFPNISTSKGNQTIKFGPLIEYKLRYFSLQKTCRKKRRETSSRPLFVFKKALCSNIFIQ